MLRIAREMTGQNRRADFLICSSEKKISLV
jgi:hypothetical protein